MHGPEDLVDHLFRHQYGRMVAILCKLFGTKHLETIEDAVQDTFSKAVLAWRKEIPDSPEAWLTRAAKNRTIDLFRKLRPENSENELLESGASAISLHQVFLDDEIEDAQLRMVFAACHPALDPRDQIAFALKTIAGFSQTEIASALLLKHETVKKRLTRARKAIAHEDMRFAVPQGAELKARLPRVLEVIYLIFNEGFHSGRKDDLVRKELCVEALRLCSLLTDSEQTNDASCYALLALMYFHAARLDSKMSDTGDVIGLENQDRRKWNFELVGAGHEAMNKAMDADSMTSYHYEAAIAAEHLNARDFAETNWGQIRAYYEQLQLINPSSFNLLNLAIVALQQKDISASEAFIARVNQAELEQRVYLYHGCQAEIFKAKGQYLDAIREWEVAVRMAKNESEKKYLEKKIEELRSTLNFLPDG